MEDNRLLGLIIVFAPLSILSFGGGQAIIADMQNQTVNVWGWLTGPQFNDLFAISRAAPGPSTLIAALIGYQVAGIIGSIVACLAIYIPSSAVVYYASSWWQNHPETRLKRSFERGLGPVAIGLLFAGALAIIRSAPVTPLIVLNLIACTAVLYFTRFSPYKMVMIVALAFFGLHFTGLGSV